jgi:hypothetical protein
LIEVDFNCQNTDEERYLKQEIYKKIKNEIFPKEGFEIKKEDLVSIINKKFPDFRSTLLEIDNYRLTGSSNTSSNTSLKLKNDTYSLIYDKTKSYEDIYHFLVNNYGPEKIDQLFDLFGKQFIEHSLSEKRTNLENLFKANYIICENHHLLETNTDPIILGMTVIGKLRDLF